MQYYDRNQSLILLAFLVLIVLVSTAVIFNLTNAQDVNLHDKTLYEISRQKPSQQSVAHITAGREPTAIGVSENTNAIYVANSKDGTVSVIDAANNTKIKDIKVGKGPTAIGVSEDISRDTITIYVANSENGTVSVIDAANNTKIKDIKVGNAPTAIGVGANIYVSNKGDGTVSVIDRTKNSKIKDIKVGEEPSAIGVGYEYHDLNSRSSRSLGTIYVANSGSDTISVIGAKNNSKIKDIKVGEGPTAIGLTGQRVYVANSVNGTVSVIDAKNNSKIKDIKVGENPIAIGISRKTVYVANFDDGTVSVISRNNDSSKITKIKDIKVGEGPTAIDVVGNTTYVANYENDTVSVIDAKNNSKIKDIKVGEGPTAIGFILDPSSIYVANNEDGTVSVIDANTSQVVTKVMFNTEPFNSGHIECDKDKIIAPTNKELYLWSGSKCTAKPNQGFEFVSWQENLGGNSTQLIKLASASTVLDSILDFFHMKPDKPQSAINITKFGSFTANFKALPPPIPPEYIATLFAVVVSTIIGSWLAPTILGWRKARKQGSKLAYYYSQIKNLYEDGKLDSNDIETLDKLKDGLTNDYTRGRVNKEQYDLLAQEISINYREIFLKEIDSLSTFAENDKAGHLFGTQSIIEDAYAKGKINESHYNLLKERLSSYDKTE